MPGRDLRRQAGRDQDGAPDVSLLRPHYYWNEIRTDTTSNSQIPAIAPYVSESRALRNADDEYVRSVWSAQMSMTSDGTNTTYGWWAQATVRLVISWDPQHLLDPSDVGDNDPLTLGFMELFPQRVQLDASPHYTVVWTPHARNLILQTPRVGLGEGVNPSVLASMWYYSQYAGFSSSFESSSIRRLRITGRVLWASSST
jgi:hypothetical protein